MRILHERKLGFKDVLIAPQRSTVTSRAIVNLRRTFRFYWSPKTWSGVPIVAANMRSIAGERMAVALSKHQMITPLHKFHSVQQLCSIFSRVDINLDYVWASIGYSDKDIAKIKDVIKKTGRQSINLVIDIANAHIDKFVDFCCKVRKTFPNTIIMAGNVASTEMAQELIIRGRVDIVKCGIAQGMVCRSANITGVGYPQFSCVVDLSHVIHGLKNPDRGVGLLCSDGGCREPGDICKAFGGGADFVMTGYLLAGTDECCGEFSNDKRTMKYYGMSSKYAQSLNDDIRDYRASEGAVIDVNSKGPVNNVIKEILGGLRSCCTYSGASSLKDLHKTAKFILV